MDTDTMRDLCDGKVWKAVDAMVKGIARFHKRKSFRIDMNNYGGLTYPKHVSRPICVGCAATCTIQQLSGIIFTVDTVYMRDERAADVGVAPEDIEAFELAVNSIRRGSAYDIVEYMYGKARRYDRMSWTIYNLADGLPSMDNDNYMEVLPQFKQFRDELKKLDI